MTTFEHWKKNKSDNNIKDSFNSSKGIAELNALENKKDKLKKQAREEWLNSPEGTLAMLKK